MFLQLKKFCNCDLLSPELGIKFGDLFFQRKGSFDVGSTVLSVNEYSN